MLIIAISPFRFHGLIASTDPMAVAVAVGRRTMMTLMFAPALRHTRTAAEPRLDIADPWRFTIHEEVAEERRDRYLNGAYRPLSRRHERSRRINRGKCEAT
ncbi:hypothetical protein ALC56_15164 [Trachymyrmex septentrionalis]|uniref:Uncharacterized protein n=1 Tax=Trachymyrmex septentrionalis TaxID=34720 RepID=A0A195EQH9_9HYME|nr:hypothetical protein ALC56_15164 [Trachymyrmex septentrionalis]